MKKLTTPLPDGEGHMILESALQPAAGGYTGQAAQRLAAFEQFYHDLAARQDKMAAELQALRDAGKQKSVRFKELWGQKMMEANTLGQLRIYGID